MSVEKQQQITATDDADDQSASLLKSNIWSYRSPLADDQRKALTFFQAYNNIFSSYDSSNSSLLSSSSFPSPDVIQQNSSTMNIHQCTLLKSERHFRIKNEKAVKPLQAETAAVPPASAADQSVQSLIISKQVEENGEEEEMQSFIAPKHTESSPQLPSRPPSYRYSSANIFSFQQPSKEWHTFSSTAHNSFLSLKSDQSSSSPPPYVITTTTIPTLSSPLRPATKSTSRLHRFIKNLLLSSTFFQKRKKKQKDKTQKLSKKIVDQGLEEDYQVTNRLEKIMKKTTLCVMILIFCAFLLLIAQNSTATNDADSKRNLLQQQIVAPSSGRLDLSKFEHLKSQVKVNRPRPFEENRRLLTAGLDGHVLSGNSGNSDNSGVEKEDSDLAIGHPVFRSLPKSKPYRPPPPRPKIKPFKVEKPTNRPHLLGDTCSSCVPAKYLAHYGLKQCSPVFRVECDCAKFYRCPQIKKEVLTKPVVKFGDDVNQPLGCQYGNTTFAFGQQIPMFSEPCRVCRCRKRRYFNGTQSSSPSLIGEIDCTPYIECPEMVFGVKASPGCHFEYQHDECCGKQLCPDELSRDDIKVKTVCRYRGKEFKYGEKIYPEEDTCKKCICNEHWNDHDPVGSKSCVQVRCTSYLKEEITRKCTPIYRSDGSCPIDYICPPQQKLYDSKDDRLDQTTSADEIPQNCTLQGKSYSIGRQLYVDRTDSHYGRVCATCSCRVPPLFTCLADFRCTGGQVKK